MNRGRALLEEADQLIAHVGDVGREPTGRLRIAMNVAPQPAGWEAVCRSLQSRFDHLQVDFLLSEAPETLLPARAELALSFKERTPVGCSGILMAECAMHLFVSNAYLETFGAPDSLNALQKHRIGVWRIPGRSTDSLPLRSGTPFAIEPHLISDDPIQLQRRVLAGDCLAYLPALPFVIDPALKVLFADEIVGSVRQTLYVPNALADVPRVARFLELCQRPISTVRQSQA